MIFLYLYATSQLENDLKKHGDEIEDWLKIRNDYSAHAQKIGPFARELWGEWRMCALVANKFDTEY